MYNSLTNYMSRMSKQILLFWVQSSFELLFCATFSMEVLQAFHQSKSVQQLKFPENSFTVPVQIKITRKDPSNSFGWDPKHLSIAGVTDGIHSTSSGNW